MPAPPRSPLPVVDAAAARVPPRRRGPGPGSRHAALAAAVQHNCDIADARHAGEQTLCIYLLQMREFFRWWQGLPLAAALDRAAVGAWIDEREALWEALQEQPLAALPVPLPEGGDPAATPFDPFDAEGINAALAGSGLVYGAGLVAQRRPVFFLAELHGRAEREGLPVLQAGVEHARTLLAPPAALAGGGAGPIVLRRESLARWCWERTEAFGLRPSGQGAQQAMVRHYGLAGDFHAALPRWLDDQCETAVLHELGEHRVGAWLGPKWVELLQALPDARSQAVARALRDQLADLTVTLPTLVERAAPGPLHAWFAGYEGWREALWPALTPAYARWAAAGARGALGDEVARAREALQSLAAGVLSAWHERRGGDDGAAAAAVVARLAAALPPQGPAARPDR